MSSVSEISNTRACLLCLPVIGPLLYLKESCDLQSRLSSMANAYGQRGNGYISIRAYGHEAVELKALKEKEVRLLGLLFIQSLLTVATLVSLVALDVLSKALAIKIGLASTLITYTAPISFCGPR
jgi:hypothetical protein